MTQFSRCNHTCATPYRCKDAKELKERLTACLLRVAECKHQFKAIDEAQKTFVVREMCRWCQTRVPDGTEKTLRNHEKIEIIINEMMADDGPVPLDLGKYRYARAKRTQSDSDTSNDMSYEDVCAIAWKRYKAGKGNGKKGSNGPGVWHRSEWTSGKGDDESKRGGKKGSKGSKLDTVVRTKEALEAKAKARAKVKTRYCDDCGEQGHLGMNCLYKWTNSIDEEEDQGSSWESEPEGEKAEELASMEAPDDEGEWRWPRRNRVTRWRKRITLLRMTRKSKRLEDWLQELSGRRKVTVVVDPGTAENVMPRSMYPEPEISNEETERSENRKGVKGPGREHIKNNGQQVMSVRTF